MISFFFFHPKFRILSFYKFPESTIPLFCLFCPWATRCTMFGGQLGVIFPRPTGVLFFLWVWVLFVWLLWFWFCWVVFVVFLLVGCLFLDWVGFFPFFFFLPYLAATYFLRTKPVISHLLILSTLDCHWAVYGSGASAFDLCHIFKAFSITLLLNCTS